MTEQQKRADRNRRTLMGLRVKVRPHRPAAKVLEIAIALTEDQIEHATRQKKALEMDLDYLKGLDEKRLEESGDERRDEEES